MSETLADAERSGQSAISMDVSIIIPCYNGSATIPGLIENLKSVLTDGIEVIFVDDGSTDGSAELFKELFPEAKSVRQDNKGVAAARNTGVGMAVGEYIQLLDVDDTIEPGKFVGQVSALRASQGDVAYSDWRMVIHDGSNVEKEPIVKAGIQNDMVEALLGGWWVPPNSYLIRRDAYLDIGGSDESLVNAQDFDLVLRLAITGRSFHYVAGYFSNYYRYINVTSLARGNRRRYWEDTEKVVKKAIHILSQNQDQLTSLRKKAAAKRLHLIARNIYSIDQNWYSRLINDIYELDGEFSPSGTLLYCTCVKFFGLNFTEYLAGVRRVISGKFTNH